MISTFFADIPAQYRARPATELPDRRAVALPAWAYRTLLINFPELRLPLKSWLGRPQLRPRLPKLRWAQAAITCERGTGGW